ncbi:MAG TPA: hypothetical protein VEZ55_14640 [Chitinophagaceae bacterium]|jgi:hypothetical protein|nr:hypothetical protein [Chitinophagaceae bacterium]
MLFGNWKITEAGINWNSNGLSHFTIPAQQLNRLRHDGDEVYYDWILLATNEDWLTQNDLYDLNFAFVYAAAKYGIEFDYDTLDATLEVQYESLDAEEDEE